MRQLGGPFCCTALYWVCPRRDELYCRANSVVAGAAAGITNHVRVAFPEAGELCRIQSRVHASQNREPPRGRHAEFTFSAKAFAVGAVGGQYFINNSTHRHNV